MGISKRKGLTAGMGMEHAELGYVSELYQEVISLPINGCKMITHPDGLGQSMVLRRENTVTIIIQRVVKDGFLKRGFTVMEDITEIKEDGVYRNGRKL